MFYVTDERLAPETSKPAFLNIMLLHHIKIIRINTVLLTTVVLIHILNLVSKQQHTVLMNLGLFPHTDVYRQRACCSR